MYANKIGDQEDIYSTSYKLREVFYKGDVVATPQGRGEILEKHKHSFEFAGELIDARPNKPLYVVSFGDRAAVYSAHNLEKSSYEEDGTPNQAAGRAISTAPMADLA